MGTTRNTVFSCADNFLRGRKCMFCGSLKILHSSRGYVKCQLCGKSKSLSRLRREIAILQGFYQLQPAYRLAQDLGVDVKVVMRVYQRLREAVFHLTELEGGKLKGEIELDEAYFGGRRKGKREAERRQAKVSALGSWSGKTASTPKSSSRSVPRNS